MKICITFKYIGCTYVYLYYRKYKLKTLTQKYLGDVDFMYFTIRTKFVF